MLLAEVNSCFDELVRKVIFLKTVSAYFLEPERRTTLNTANSSQCLLASEYFVTLLVIGVRKETTETVNFKVITFPQIIQWRDDKVEIAKINFPAAEEIVINIPYITPDKLEYFTILTRLRFEE